MANTTAQTWYGHLPPALQNAALNLLGVRNHRRLVKWRRIIDDYRETETWSPERQLEFTAEALVHVLVHAIEHVPYYLERRELRAGASTKGREVFAWLSEFPIVTREEVRRQPASFLSSAFVKRRLAHTITSGTTGTPFTTWIEKSALLRSDALWWRRTVWAGHRDGDYIARLVGDPVIPLTWRDPDPAWRVSQTDRRIYFSTYHLNDRTALAIGRFLAERRPAFLMGYPSALDALARLTRKVDYKAWEPKALLFSSEPMFDHQREQIAKVFGAPLRGLYGCAERIVSAAQCEHETYHLSLVDGYVEGQFGFGPVPQPAVVTGLLNRAMPLIRYQLGDDLAFVLGKECRCGRRLPSIDPVVTKWEDCVVTPSGRVIAPSVLTWAFKELDGVEKTQIIQRSSHRVEVLVQTKFSGEELQHIRTTIEGRLNKMFFGELDVDVSAVAEVQMTSAGKTRFVVNESAARR